MNILTALCLSVLLPAAAAADVYNCDGRWTNLPCKGEVRRTLAAPPAVKQEAPSEMKKKKDLLHELRMSVLRLKRSYDARIDTGAVETFCLDEKTTLADCGRKVDEVMDRVDSKAAEAELVAERKRTNKLLEDANRLQEERNRIEASQQPVVIVPENRIIEVVPRYPRHYHHPGRPPGHIEHHGSGISVNARGRAGGTEITVSGSTGGSVPSFPKKRTVLSDHFPPSPGRNGR